MKIDSRRTIKEMIVSQRSVSVWFTGLSGSGKSTLAYELDSALAAQGYLSAIIDDDEIKSGLNSNLSFSEDDRTENIRRVAEISKILVNNGTITLNAFICPTEKIRNMAKTIIGKDDFVLVYLDASLEACEKRDTKGMYKKAPKGEIKDFKGVSLQYEIPKEPDLIIDTVKLNVDDCIVKLVEFLLPRISGKMK